MLEPGTLFPSGERKFPHKPENNHRPVAESGLGRASKTGMKTDHRGLRRRSQHAAGVFKGKREAIGGI